MDTQELDERGLKLRLDMFGAEVDRRVAALGEFGAPLQHIINAYAYGDVWSRGVLPLATKSLAMVAMMAVAGREAELRVHLKGALKNGCTADEIREILLLVTLYCGIPAGNEAHKAAVEVIRETERCALDELDLTPRRARVRASNRRPARRASAVRPAQTGPGA